MPHRCEQVVLAHHPLAVVNEIGKQIEDLRFECDEVAATTQLAPVEIERKVFKSIEQCRQSLNRRSDRASLAHSRCRKNKGLLKEKSCSTPSAFAVLPVFSATFDRPPPTGRQAGGLTLLMTGKDYLDSIRDGRRVYVGGERVDDVTTHPAFRNAARSFAMIYERKRAPENRDVMTFEEEGETFSTYFLLPHTRDDLWRRFE